MKLELARTPTHPAATHSRNSIPMTNGNANYIFYALNHDDNPFLRVEFRYSSLSYQVRADAVNDNWSWSQTAWVTISDAPHAIEFNWQAASAAGANNGVLTFWVDGVQQGSFTNLDNDTRFIDYVQWGIVGGVDNGMRGTLYFDAFESRRDSYIGLTAINSGMEQAAQISAPLTALSMPQSPFQSGAMLQSLQQEGSVTTRMQSAITYTYDSLYRLAGADYSDGIYFRYTYDAVGNRLAQETGTITNTYSYDAANRLTSVDGVPYTWDNNGNLLSDGVYTYTFNHANQLVSVSGMGTTVSYGYNGQGDRISQTVGITTTTYTLDLAAGLTQVLSDGTDTYLYGGGRIAQYDTSGAQYFLGDALGSVRQLVDANGEVLLAQSYEPYGELMTSVGEGTSSYGFAAEMRDPTGLIYLRARYYAYEQGRFLQRDPWRGNLVTPLSLNPWLYVLGNPIVNTDPSGKITQTEAKDADDIVNRLKIYYVFVKKDWGQNEWLQLVNWKIVKNCQWEDGKWTLKELETLEEAVKDLGLKVGGSSKFPHVFGSNTIEKKKTCGRGCTLPSPWTKIEFTDTGIPPTKVEVLNRYTTMDKWTVVHEFGHAWDRLYAYLPQRGLENFTKGYTDWFGSQFSQNIGLLKCDAQNRLPGCNNAGYFYGDIPPAGADAFFNRAEDLAESVAAYVYPVEAQSRVQIYLNDPQYGNLYYSDYTKTLRYKFIDSQFKNIP